MVTDHTVLRPKMGEWEYRWNKVHLRKSQEPPFNTDDELPYDIASPHEYNDEADQVHTGEAHTGDADKALPPQRRIQRQRKPPSYLEDYDTT